MYSHEIRSSFVELRANGFTINEISEKLGIHRCTLIQWNKELYADIKIAEQNEFDIILAEVGVEKRRRVKAIGEQLAACYDILESDEKNNVDFIKLLTLIEKLTKLLHKETGENKFISLLKKPQDDESNYPIVVTDEEVYKKLQSEHEAKEEAENEKQENEFYLSRLEKLNEEYEEKLTEENFENEQKPDFLENLVKEETEFFTDLRKKLKGRLNKLDNAPAASGTGKRKRSKANTHKNVTKPAAAS